MSIYWTWPLASYLPSRIAPDPGDPILNTWILWWNTQAVPLTRGWWNAPMFDPLAGTLALSEHLLGISLYATPLQMAGASPVLAYNLSLILSFALSGFFAYLLACRLTGSHAAGLCAGVAFGFAPYRLGQLSHLQVLTSQWLPLMVLGLHGFMSDGRRRWLGLFGACWLIQSLANSYYVLFMPVLIALWLAYFIDWRQAPSRAGGILLAWAVASLPLLPIVLEYRAVHGALGLGRSPGDIRQFSATIASFTQVAPLAAVWPAGAAQNQEHYLFPGITAPLVVALAFMVVALRGQLRASLRRRSPLLFFALATLVMWAMALGPGPENVGASTLLYPYRWLWWLPGFDGLRVPARFAMLGSFCLATAAALAVATLRPPSRTARIAMAFVVFVGLSLDGLPDTVPVVPLPARVLPAGPSEAAVLEIPTDDSGVSIGAMYRSMTHRRTLVNGYSGYVPPHYAVLSLALRRGDTSPLEYFARGRPLTILVSRSADRDGSFRNRVAALPGVQPHGETAAGAMFLLPSRSIPRPPPNGSAIPFHVTWADRLRLQIDLETSKHVSMIAVPVRRRFQQVDPRILVEASDDGVTWRQAWLGWTGALMLEAALVDPLLVTMRIRLDVRTRYLRVYPAASWMADEMTVAESRIPSSVRQ